jgi:hypothetical protein
LRKERKKGREGRNGVKDGREQKGKRIIRKGETGQQ